MSDVTLSNVSKSFGQHEVLKGIDLTIPSGEFVVFVGPSGCGKSTLLRIIAGLETITDGEIKLGGEVANAWSPTERGVAMVFQSYALYPHMTVAGNMGFALKVAGASKDEIKSKVEKAASILDLSTLLDRLPRQLSGGQRQRVAIGRAIVREPKLFLFDEPLSNLDAALRGQTRVEIANLHQKLDTTMIYVTHDQVEAMTLADRIVVLNAGRIEQIGAPEDLYERPANLFVAGFIGSPRMNFFKAEVAGGNGVKFASGGAVKVKAHLDEKAIVVGVRPEKLLLADAGKGVFNGTVGVVEYMGENAHVHLHTAASEPVVLKVNRVGNLATGQTVGLTFDPGEALMFSLQTGQRL
jgi:ABC-type sugar transport system ATPase subunit